MYGKQSMLLEQFQNELPPLVIMCFSPPFSSKKVLKLYLESYPVLNLNEFYSQSSWKNVTYYSLFILIMHAII